VDNEPHFIATGLFPNQYRCTGCGHIVVTSWPPEKIHCSCFTPTTVPPAHHQQRKYISTDGGPGTELERLLKMFGIEASPGCSCHARAALMDHRGPEWCEQNIETIIGWLEEEAKRRRLPFIRPGARILIHRAIKAARKKAKEGKGANISNRIT